MGKKHLRATCPKCGLEVVEWRLQKHIDDGWCISRQNLNALRENHGLDIPSHKGSTVSTVKMLARHAGIELEKEPVGCFDYGKTWRKNEGKKTPDGLEVNQRYMVHYLYVAPLWLIKVATAWRTVRRSQKGRPFPKGILKRLPDAVNNERLQGALITQLTLQRRT